MFTVDSLPGTPLISASVWSYAMIFLASESSFSLGKLCCVCLATGPLPLCSQEHDMRVQPQEQDAMCPTLGCLA